MTEPTPTNITCYSCQDAKMDIIMSEEGGGGIIKCTGCNASYHLSPHGYSSMSHAILFPGRTSPGSSCFLEYLNYYERMCNFAKEVSKVLMVPYDDKAHDQLIADIDKARESHRKIVRTNNIRLAIYVAIIAAIASFFVWLTL